MKKRFFAVIAGVMMIASVLGAQDVFTLSAFGWGKNVEKRHAKGTLTLFANDALRLYSPDKLLVRACSISVPGDKLQTGDELLLSYEGRAAFEAKDKTSRGGMILINVDFSDGTRTRKMLGARFGATTPAWTARTAKFKVTKKIKSLYLWCDLADVKGSFEIRNLRLRRNAKNVPAAKVETIDQDIFKNVSKSAETTLTAKPNAAATLNSRTIILDQNSPAPVIVSAKGKASGTAWLFLFVNYADGTRDHSRQGLIFTADDKEWTLRKTGFYPKKAIKSIIIRGVVPKGTAKFSFKELKIENLGIRQSGGKTAKNIIPNPQDRLPMWIWSNSGFAPQQTICLRQEFELPDEPVSGTLNFAADDLCKIFINGKTALNKGSFYCAPVDAAKFLKKGKNCIGAEVTNFISSAGFLAYGEVLLKNGKTIRITAGEDWKTGPQQKSPAFSVCGFDDRFWGNAIIINSATHDHPWRDRIEVARFLPKKNYEEYKKNNERIKKSIPQMLAAIDRRLKNEKPIGDVTYIRKNNLPFIKVAGHGLMLGSPYYSVARTKPRSLSGFDRLNRLNDLGFRVLKNQVMLSSAWKADGSVDIKEQLENLRYILAAAPDCYLILGINLDPPEWFVKKYPQEMIGYDNAAKRVFNGDALKQPLLRPSMASELWLELCGAAVKDCVRQIEASPIGKRVIAYMPTYGVYSEWHYYGMAQNMPDTSEPMLKFFRKYLKNKYKTDAALQKAWHDKSVTLHNAPRPTKAQRLLHKNGKPYKAGMDHRVPDFDTAIGLAINDCQKFFNQCVRDAAKRKVLLGNYSGYFFGMAYPAFGWHTGTPDIMKSDKMDFQVSPFPYGWRYSGQSGMPRSVWESYAFNAKVPLMEADTRTHQSGPIAGKTSTCTEDSIGQINREFCNSFTRGGTLWYYDFDRAWFDYPEYFKAFKKLLEIWQLKGSDVTRVSEMAVVCDFGSVPYHTASVNPNTYASSLISYPANEMNFVGAPYDAILMEDIIDGKAPDYKFYVVLNMVHNTPAKEAAVRKLLARGATVLFIYRPEWLGKAPAGAVYADSYRVPRGKLRSLAAKAGVHFYCDDLDSMVFACRGFVGIHRKEAGNVTIKLPRSSKNIRQLLPAAKTVKPGNKIRYSHPEYGTVLFKI